MEKDNKKDISSYREEIYGLLFLSKNIEEDPKTIYLMKKTEKLAAVLYRITENYETSEPLKNHIRSLAIDSIQSVLHDNFSQNGERVIITFVKIVAALSLAKGAGKISPGNYDILKDQYENLCETINTKDFGMSLENYLEGPIIDKGPYSVGVSDKGQKDIQTNMSFKKSLKDGRILKVKDSIKSSNFSIKESNSNNRSENIVLLIKEKGEVSIKDISSHIKDIGEKTIQRELLRLVADGKLKKTGERRWSRYSLKN